MLVASAGCEQLARAGEFPVPRGPAAQFDVTRLRRSQNGWVVGGRKQDNDAGVGLTEINHEL